ncbi:hypothetical protein CRG98_045853 [Punica granatum]|nr:hypothetical protein CRG98_045853 [Punica granatum]
MRVGSIANQDCPALPPLTDSSPQTTKAEPVPESAAYVPCFSNPIENKEHTDPLFTNIDPLFSVSSNASTVPRVPILGSLYSGQPVSIPPNQEYPGPVLMQEQSILRALLENPNLKVEREMIDASQEVVLASNMNHPEMSSVVPGFDLGRRVAFRDQHQHQHQQAPSTSAAGPSELDFIWNY